MIKSPQVLHVQLLLMQGWELRWSIQYVTAEADLFGTLLFMASGGG